MASVAEAYRKGKLSPAAKKLFEAMNKAGKKPAKKGAR